MYVLDAYAWFEYFFATKKGEKVKERIESNEFIVTPSIALFEIKNKLVREKKPFEKWIKFIMERSLIEPLTAEIALKAALIKKCKLITETNILKNWRAWNLFNPYPIK